MLRAAIDKYLSSGEDKFVSAVGKNRTYLSNLAKKLMGTKNKF